MASAACFLSCFILFSECTPQDFRDYRQILFLALTRVEYAIAQRSSGYALAVDTTKGGKETIWGGGIYLGDSYIFAHHI